jgi:hypothetical protein
LQAESQKTKRVLVVHRDYPREKAIGANHEELLKILIRLQVRERQLSSKSHPRQSFCVRPNAERSPRRCDQAARIVEEQRLAPKG